MPAIERPFGAWRVHSLSDGGYFVFGCNGAVCSSARAANVQPISIVRSLVCTEMKRGVQCLTLETLKSRARTRDQ